MLKLYLVIALIYAILKTLNTDEKKTIGIVWFFLTQFFLFPVSAIKDMVKIFIPKPDKKGRR